MGRKSRVIVVLALLVAFPALGKEAKSVPGGELRIRTKGRETLTCPLKRTTVEADIVGFFGRVTVRQRFHNPLAQKIEAVYVFPLPDDSAVDSMMMIVGNRVIEAEIKEREEARKTYEKAKSAGHVAALLDQERPNIFTQAVANIEPGAVVDIEISYVQTLKYEDGLFEFVFPMVVGPRFIPGRPTSRAPRQPAELAGKVHEPGRARTPGGPAAPAPPAGTGWSPDTDRVPDASRITPPVAKPGFRSGHDIGLTVNIFTGMGLMSIDSELHEVDVKYTGEGAAVVTLKNQRTIPNRDFILRYAASDADVGDAFLVHTDKRGTFFTLILQPPRKVPAARAVPKEMIFVIDRSGSMRGLPIEKAKATMKLCIQQMNPKDTFNLLSFSGGTGRCFDSPQPNTLANRTKALRYLAGLHGSGGTRMMPAIQEALGGKHDPERLRVVCFMTDGYIGNDFEIIDAVKKHSGTARVFSFGIGNGVNSFLLEGMAEAGRGEVEFVSLKSKADESAERFAERIHSPVLTDVAIDWGRLKVEDVYPARCPDLFSARPVVVRGRLKGEADGTVTLKGRTVRGAFERKFRVLPPRGGERRDALATLWARAKVKHLMRQDMRGMQRGSFAPELEKKIVALGLEYRLMTQFTSFVAVEKTFVTKGGDAKTVPVAVEMPDGVSHEGVFGRARAARKHLKPTGSTPMGISDIPLGGTGVVGNIGVGGGGAGCFGYRTGGGRRRAVVRYGGSKASESSVDMALRWLARNQEPDGSWSAAKHGGKLDAGNDAGTTGLALLAFLGAGHTETAGKYKQNVRQAVAYLNSRRALNGRIGPEPDGRKVFGWSHAIAGLALSEAYGMARQAKTGAAAQKAVDYSARVHQVEYGGWGHAPKGAEKLSVTAWYVAQLKSAKVAGLTVDGTSFAGAAAFIEKVTVEKGDGAGRSSDSAGAAVTREASARALACRLFMGEKPTDAVPATAAKFIGEAPPAWPEDGKGVDLGHWYFATLGLFQMGGEHWKSWNKPLKSALVARQRRGGDEDGSWDPVGPWAAGGGRVHSTALAALTLEVYYRYLPLYGK